MNFNGNGTGSFNWWTPSTTRDASPIGCVARVEGRTTSLMVRPRLAYRLHTGGEVGQDRAFARLAVSLVRVLPVFFLDPLCKESVHEGADDGRRLSSTPVVEDAFLLPKEHDLGVQTVTDLVERGAHVGEPVAPGRVAQKVEEDEVEPAVRLRSHEDGVDHRRNLLLCGVGIRYRLADTLGDAGEHPAHGQERQILLGVEVVGQDGLAHPGLVRDVLQ